MFFLTETGFVNDVVEQEVAEAIENPSIIVEWWKDFLPGAIHFLIQIAIAVVILLVGLRLISFLVKILRKSFEKSNMEKGVSTFLCSLVRYILYFILVMIILSQFGVAAGSVIAVLGSAGLTVGLALQGSLSNFAGGVLILILKPFVVGDYILAGAEEGTVEEITIFYTHLLTVDNKRIVIPNGTLSNTNITNFSRMETRRVDVRVGIAYDADLAKAKAVLLELAEGTEAVLKDQQIDVFVAELAESSVNLELRVWVKNEDYWPAKWSLTENIKLALDENQISIPYPHVTVELEQK